MSTTVTLADLESLRACRAQRAIFAATFPEGVTITPTNYRAVAEAVAEAKLNADWYARRVLNGGDLAAYDAAWAEARAAYHATEAPAWAAYEAVLIEAKAGAWAAYEAVEAPARAAYDAAWAEARAAYEAAVAYALCSILVRRGEP